MLVVMLLMCNHELALTETVDGIMLTYVVSGNGDKIDSSSKEAIEKAVEELKAVKDGEDAEAIKAKIEALQQASHKLAEAMYRESQSSAQPEAEPAGSAETGNSKKEGDDVVDADFEEVK